MTIRTKLLPIPGLTVCKGLILLSPDACPSVLVHEQVHEKEWSLVWLVKYLLSPIFRVKAEFRAYKAQANSEGSHVTYYWKIIQDKYMLNAEAKALLTVMMWEAS